MFWLVVIYLHVYIHIYKYIYFLLVVPSVLQATSKYSKRYYTPKTLIGDLYPTKALISCKATEGNKMVDSALENDFVLYE